MNERIDERRKQKNSLIRLNSYSFRFYKYFDYSLFKHIPKIYRSGKKGESYTDAVIMLDTETSKERAGEVCENYVVAWTISIRALGMNIVTLYGTRPTELIWTLNKLLMNVKADNTIIYVHNLSYDWVFLRKFFLASYGTPEAQLNTKPHYPLFIRFANGLMLRDSLILAQRSLDKWAKDLDVDHKKACGYWDYDNVRIQGQRFTPDEKTYIEHDTLAGVECIDKTMNVLGKHIYSMLYTATGIPREAVQKLAKADGWRERFLKIVPDYDTQRILEYVFHGGYTHNNRHYCERVITERLKRLTKRRPILTLCLLINFLWNDLRRLRTARRNSFFIMQKNSPISSSCS